MKELSIINNPDHLMGFAVAIVVFIILLSLGGIVNFLINHFSEKDQ